MIVFRDADLLNIINKKNEWIKNMTGWSDTQIYQIQYVLFKYSGYSAEQLKRRAITILPSRLDESIANDIVKCIDSYDDIDLETIHYKIKNGFNELRSDFSDRIKDIISKHYNLQSGSEPLRVYEAVADAFITNY
eukprot:294879_1